MPKSKLYEPPPAPLISPRMNQQDDHSTSTCEISRARSAAGFSGTAGRGHSKTTASGDRDRSYRTLIRASGFIPALFAVCLSGFVSGPVAAADEATPKQISGLKRELDAILAIPAPAKYRLSARVVDLETHRVLYDRNGSAPLMPASNMKLVVMAAAIEELGPDYQFRTRLAIRDVDLVVIGGGDPTFGDERLADARKESMTAVFKDWARVLKETGIRQIPGNIVVDDLLFDLKFTHPSWPANQYQSWYEAPIGGLNFNANCVQAVVIPTKPKQPARVMLVPANAGLPIDNKTITGKKNAATIARYRDSDTLMLRGSVAKKGTLQAITVRDPGLYFGSVLKSVLEAEGIKIVGRVVREKIRPVKGKLPDDCNLVAVHRAPIADALRRCGKDSLGMIAEGLFKTLGARRDGLGTWDSGRKAVEAFLDAAGIDKDQYTLDDGSGLSRKNRLSARVATGLLLHMHESSGEKFKLFKSALAVAGTDGTMKKRLRGPDTKGRILAKTGYINGVWALAGYIHTQSNHWLAFAFYYNDVKKTPSPKKRIDRACRRLVHWPNKPPKKNEPRKASR